MKICVNMENAYLKSNSRYDTEFFNVGDGISVSTKK